MILNSSNPTEFYVSDVGYLVIKQECCECGHEAQFLLTPEQTRALFSMAADIMQQQEQTWTGIYSKQRTEDVDK